MNDVPYNYPIEFRKGDVLGVKYKIRCLGEPDFGDYMNFLHDCYKHEEINIDINYSGGWIKNIWFFYKIIYGRSLICDNKLEDTV